MSAWNQAGFVPVSQAGPLPMLHGFFLTRWEAEAAAKELRVLSEELHRNAQIVPAGLNAHNTKVDPKCRSKRGPCMGRTRWFYLLGGMSERSGPFGLALDLKFLGASAINAK